MDTTGTDTTTPTAGELARAVSVLERHGKTQGKGFQDIVAVLRLHATAVEGQQPGIGMSEELKARLETKLADVVGCGLDEAVGIIEGIWPLIAAALPASAIPEDKAQTAVVERLTARKSEYAKERADCQRGMDECRADPNCHQGDDEPCENCAAREKDEAMLADAIALLSRQPLPEPRAETLGMSIDMLDVDRLREWARVIEVYGPDMHLHDARLITARLTNLADRLETAVRDIGKLRASTLPPLAPGAPDPDRKCGKTILDECGCALCRWCLAPGEEKS